MSQKHHDDDDEVRKVVQLDLAKIEKSAKVLQLSLNKAGIYTLPKIEVVYQQDVSNSYVHEIEEGLTDVLVERLMPWAFLLDPDGQIDCFTFSGGVENAHYNGVITKQNYANYIRDHVEDQVPGWAGNTDYSYVLEAALAHLGWLPKDQMKFASPSILDGVVSRFKSFFGVKPAVSAAPVVAGPAVKKVSLIVKNTDGECSADDLERNRKVLRDAAEKGYKVYILYLGNCCHGPDFKYIKAIANEFPNTGVVIIDDLEEFVELSDEELNQRLLVPELVEWLKQQ